MSSRRAWLVGAGAAFAAYGARVAPALARKPAPPEPLVLPVAIAVAVRAVVVDGEAASAPVVGASFVVDQLARANEIFGEHAIRFAEQGSARELPESAARLETRADRDALATSMLEGVVNVFIVESLRDVDEPSRMRMGVCWRKLSDLAKRYVIVAASAVPTVLAHELGHFVGNGHSYVKNNLMSYQRDGGKVFLDAAQGRRSRATAQRLLASKALTRVE